MKHEICAGVDWDIDSEILNWAEVDGGWSRTDLWDHCTVVKDVLDDCPSIDVDCELYDAGPLSGAAYIVSTDDPVVARKEIRDRIAAMIRQWRREQQAEEEFIASTPTVERDELSPDEVRIIAREVCAEGAGKSAIDGFKGWDGIEVDAFTHDNHEPVPGRARSVAWMQGSAGVADFYESIFFRRTRFRDELWVDGDLTGGRVISAPRSRRKIHAMHRLLAVLIRARAGFAWPESFSGSGPVSDEAAHIILTTIKEYLDEKRQEARNKGTDAEIVQTARELEMSPAPRSGSDRTWQACCPSGNHFIDISPESNTWFCGYCGGKGGPVELREFVAGKRNK